jgi:hypothetical protein
MYHVALLTHRIFTTKDGFILYIITIDNDFFLLHLKQMNSNT